MTTEKQEDQVHDTVLEDHKEEESNVVEACIEKNGQLRKQKKNCIAIIILLGGFVCGSLFIDVVQLFAQKGFSARAIKDAQVVEYDGSTWVRYDDPKIVVDVYDAEDCADCVTDDVLVRLRSYIPTIEAHRIDVRTEEGKALAKQEKIAHIPAFVFSKNVDESDFYQQAAMLFKEHGKDKYYFDTPSVGVPIGEYLEQPPVENGIHVGDTQAPITIVAYENPVSDESRTMFGVIDKLVSEMKDSVHFVIKMVPVPEQKNSADIAKAALCASEQDKYVEFMRLVNADYRTIATSEILDEKYNVYLAKLNMEGDKFHTCLNEDRIADMIEEHSQEASRFGVMMAPTYFVGNKPLMGVVTYENFKAQIEAVKNGTSAPELTPTDAGLQVQGGTQMPVDSVQTQ